MMQQNMSSMGKMMMTMGNTLERENMSAKQLKECAAHMESLSRIMMKSANDIELKGVKVQQKEIEKLAEEWNYFESSILYSFPSRLFSHLMRSSISIPNR